MPTTISAQANIALIKYWGKRDSRLNLPEASSLSITLDALTTTTTVDVCGGRQQHRLHINGAEDPKALKQAMPVLDLLCREADLDGHLRIDSTNSFPTAAGLASSASGLAALTMAAASALGLDEDPRRLSAIARRGSGSASRSLFGGYVMWERGKRSDGSDSVARQLYGPEYWDLRALVCVVSSAEKSVGSRDGMALCARTSPYHQAFIANGKPLMASAMDALERRDFLQLAQATEASCLRMHADMMAATPPLLYLNPISWRLIHEVRCLRAKGLGVFFTADAGPNIKVFCLPESLDQAKQALSSMRGLESIIASAIGHGPRVETP